METEWLDKPYTLVLNQPGYLDPGYVGSTLAQRGYPWRLESRGDFDWKLDERVEAVVLLGSIESPLDHKSHLRTNELALIDQVLSRNIPLLAVCYGAQLLAQCLSSEVFELPKVGFGFRTVDFANSDLPTGRHFFWHHFAFNCPSEASALAMHGPACDAFIYKKSLAVQFHPDATPEILETWLKAGSEEVRALNASAEDQLRVAQGNRHFSKGFMASAVELVRSL